MAEWRISIPIPDFMRPNRAPVAAPAPQEPERRPPPVIPSLPGESLPYFVAQRRAANREVTRVLSEATLDGELPPPPADESSIEALIIAGLDRSALTFLKILESDERDPVTNVLRVDAKTRMEAFKMLVDWTVKRKKAAPDGDGDTAPPYEKIRKWLDDAGFEIVQKKRVGRPTKEMIEKRAMILGVAEEMPPKTPEPPTADGELHERLARLAAAKKTAPQEVTADAT